MKALFYILTIAMLLQATSCSRSKRIAPQAHSNTEKPETIYDAESINITTDTIGNASTTSSNKLMRKVTGVEIERITKEEYEEAARHPLKQPELLQNTAFVKRLAREFYKEDSLRKIYDVHKQNGIFFTVGCDDLKINTAHRIITNEGDSLYILHIPMPMESRSYLYNSKAQRISQDMFNSYNFDGTLCAASEEFDSASEEFDSDDFVWFRFYRLSTSGATLCAEIASTFTYCVSGSYFFSQNHDFYFMMCKKWDGPNLFYKAKTSELKE